MKRIFAVFGCFSVNDIKIWNGLCCPESVGFYIAAPQIVGTSLEEIVKAFPRNYFKKKIIPTFFGGFEHKTETTFGNIKADVCAFMIPNFKTKNFCDCILHSPWSE